MLVCADEELALADGGRGKLLVPLQWTGIWFSRLVPSSRGPRHNGQFSARATGESARTRQLRANRNRGGKDMANGLRMRGMFPAQPNRNKGNFGHEQEVPRSSEGAWKPAGIWIAATCRLPKAATSLRTPRAVSEL